MKHHMLNGKSNLVPVKNIDVAPGPYAMSFGFDPEKMIASVERFGLLNSPFVETKSNGKIEVIAGYRRILAAKAMGWEQVSCMDISDSGLSSFEKLLLNLHDNLATRTFNDVEKGMILDRLFGHISKLDIVTQYMPLLGLPSHEPLFRTLLRLKELDTSIKLALIEKRLSFQTIESLLNMELDSRSAVFEWLSNIIFNFKQQNYFIEFINDITIREGITIPQLLLEEGLLRILRAEKLNKPQKVKHVLEELRGRRFPRLRRSEKRLQSMISAVHLPVGVTVRHSPFFETQDFRLEIRFRDGKDLKSKILHLSNLGNLEGIEAPWKED